MDAQQELFTRLKIDLEAQGYRVFDGFLPPASTPYPFIYLGINTQSDRSTKTQVIGEVKQTIHVWHNDPRQRGTVSAMLYDIKKAFREIEHTANYSWMPKNPTQRILQDNTTKTPLLHGVLEVTALFS